MDHFTVKHKCIRHNWIPYQMKQLPAMKCSKPMQTHALWKYQKGLCPKREYTKLKGYDDICGVSPDG